MAAAIGQESTGLLDKILPAPRLQDAGLGAFIKAASAVMSRATTFFTFPGNGKCSSGVLVWPPCPEVCGESLDPIWDALDGCVKGKGCLDVEIEGLKIKDEDKKKSGDKEKEKPTLAYGFL